MNKVFLVFLGLIFFHTGCSNSTNQYSGQIIQIDYSGVKSIKDSSWIKIDNWKFTHFRSIKAAKQNQYSLPASYALLDSLDNRSIGTSVKPRGMGLYIARNLDDINKTQLSPGESKYRILDIPLITLKGIIKITKANSEKIQVVVPKNYPAQIEVLEP